MAEALDAMGYTRLVISYRMSTILHCDRIPLLYGGGIVEENTYDPLIARGASSPS